MGMRAGVSSRRRHCPQGRESGARAKVSGSPSAPDLAEAGNQKVPTPPLPGPLPGCALTRRSKRI
eukprot:2896393-Pyramimonas_sp.AAC.1